MKANLHTLETDYDTGRVRFVYRLIGSPSGHVGEADTPEIEIVDVHVLVTGHSGQQTWFGALKHEDASLRAWAHAELVDAMIEEAVQAHGASTEPAARHSIGERQTPAL